MNNAKIWLVVKPTVGIPMFLGAVAVGSFAVHYTLLQTAPWLQGFYHGKPIGQTAAIEAVDDVQSASIIFDESGYGVSGGMIEATIILPDGRKARAIFDADTAALDDTALGASKVDKH